MLDLKNWSSECLPLTVKRVYFVLFCAVKAFIWKVQWIFICQFNHLVAHNFLGFIIKDKTVVSKWIVMVQVAEDQVVVREAACDVRIWKIVDRHRVFVQKQLIVYIKFIWGNFILSSIIITKSSHSESAIVNVSDSKVGSIRVLLNFLEFDVTVVFTSNLFFKHHLEAF